MQTVQPKLQGIDNPQLREALVRVYADINKLQGRFLGAFTTADPPPTTDPALYYCWIWNTTTNKPAWLDPSYPRWQYADGTAM